jgi:molybdopterin-binding protein
LESVGCNQSKGGSVAEEKKRFSRATIAVEIAVEAEITAEITAKHVEILGLAFNSK